MGISVVVFFPVMSFVMCYSVFFCTGSSIVASNVVGYFIVEFSIVKSSTVGYSSCGSSRMKFSIVESPTMQRSKVRFTGNRYPVWVMTRL